MARYYLHIRDGEKLIRDTEGVALPSIVSAKGEAENAARENLVAKVRSGDIDGQEFEIHDAWGKKMLNVPFRSVLRLE